MKLWRRVAVAAFVAAVVSALFALLVQYMAFVVERHELREVTAESSGRRRAEQIEDAKVDAIRFGRVLVPVSMLVVWWLSKRRSSGN
jgi:hypothetical protein